MFSFMTRSIGGTALQETKMEKVYREVFGGTIDSDCRNFRMEMRSPDGKIRYYSLKASDKNVARKEAVALVHHIVKQFQDERIIWRMAGDKNWSIGSATSHAAKPSMFKRFVDYFFLIED